MLENVNVHSIIIDEHRRAFANSELQDIKKESILTHFVRLSQEKGEWITEVSLRKFAKTFTADDFTFGGARDFCVCVYALKDAGYLTIVEDKNGDILKVTEKFAELCEKYAA